MVSISQKLLLTPRGSAYGCGLIVQLNFDPLITSLDTIGLSSNSLLWVWLFSDEVATVVTKAQEEVQNKLDKEVQGIQLSEGEVSHAVDERKVPEKDYVEPDSC